jgi:hypothetical protein
MYHLTVHGAGNDHIPDITMSHSEIPASSRLKTNSTFIPWKSSRRKLKVSSRKARGISSLASSWGVLFVSDQSAFVTQDEGIDPSPRSKTGIFNFPMGS